MIELQKIDCNCNDCIFMVRDMEKFKLSLKTHEKWQLDYFNVTKANLKKRAEERKLKGETEKANNILKEISKMRFQFDKSTCSINYGNCTKLNKSVSFIPNILQIETQHCFKHRREL